MVGKLCHMPAAHFCKGCHTTGPQLSSKGTHHSCYSGIGKQSCAPTHHSPWYVQQLVDYALNVTQGSRSSSAVQHWCRFLLLQQRRSITQPAAAALNLSHCTPFQA